MLTPINGYLVIHPLDDSPEEKCSAEGLGLMHFSRSVRWSLLTLRAYLVLMGLLIAYRVFSMAHHVL